MNAPKDDWGTDTTLLKFDQTDFITHDDMASTGMRSRGWLFFPNTCKTTQCKLVVWLNSRGSFGSEYLESNAKIGAFAASNNQVILMPQSDIWGNTDCWDAGQYTSTERDRAEGYTGSDIWGHSGVQVQAIMRMI